MRWSVWLIVIAAACGGTGQPAGPPWCGGKPKVSSFEVGNQAPYPHDLALEGDTLYWLDGSGIHTSDPKTSIVPAPVGAFVLDGDAILYLTSQNGVTSLLSVPKAGGTAKTIATNLSWTTLIAVDADSIFGGDPGYVARIAKTGGAEVMLTANDATKAVMDATHVYFMDPDVGGAESRGISRVPKSGGAREGFYSAAKEYVRSIAIDANAVYFVSCLGLRCGFPNIPDAYVVGSVNKMNRAKRELVHARRAYGDIAVGGNAVFVTRGGFPLYDGGSPYGIERFALGGGSVTIDAPSNRTEGGVFGIVANETGAYAVVLEEAINAIYGMTCQ
jgi:hypothetical protein